MNLRRYSVGRCGLDSSGLGYRPKAGTYEHDNEPSGSTKCEAFVDYLSDY